jgi:ABC-type antimicrobial peptide transport system, ATPase component
MKAKSDKTDEVAENAEIAGTLELLTLLNRESGITIIMVTHEPDMAAYAKRTVRFLDGRVASDERNGRQN